MEPDAPTPRLPFGLKTEHVTLGLLVLSTVLIVVLVQQNNRLRAGYLPKPPCGCEDADDVASAGLGDRFAPDLEGVNGNGHHANGLRPDPTSDSFPPASR